MWQCIAAQPSGAAPLRALSDALRGALAEYFSVGLLSLLRLTWSSSSAALLEKVCGGAGAAAAGGAGTHECMRGFARR